MELTLDQALQRGVEAHKAGKVQDAERYYTAILKTDPKHPDANHNIGVLAVGVGKVETALPFFKTALDANPSIAQFWISYIDALIKLDRITDAKEVFDQAKSKNVTGDEFDKLEERLGLLNETIVQEPSQDQLQSLINLYRQGQLQRTLQHSKTLLLKYPRSAVLFNIAGAVFRGLGQLDSSIEAYQKALLIRTDYAEAYSNMGITLQDQGKLKEAIEAYKKALLIRTDYAEAYNNMGTAFQEQEKPDKAIEAYKEALSIKPDYAEAYNNIGTAFIDQGKLEDAIKAYSTALSIKPDYAEAYNNSGNALRRLGKPDKAIEACKEALSIKPDYAEAYNNIGTAFIDQGKLEDAIKAYSTALSIKPDYVEAQNNVGATLKNVQFRKPNQFIQDLLISMLRQKSKVRPKDIATAAISLLKFEPRLEKLFTWHYKYNHGTLFYEAISAISDTPLLLKLMTVCPLPDTDLEIALKSIRSYILSSISTISENSNLLQFQSALALQCFTNEYIYSVTTDDAKLLSKLETSVREVLLKGEQPNSHSILCLASFKALNEYDWSNLLSISSNIEEVYIRQIIEPKEEETLRSNIKVLGEINDEVSLKVNAQYEENPYPRWVNLSLNYKNASIDRVVAENGLKLFNTSIKNVQAPDILIAGCGTGQHSIGTAARFKNSNVTAVDLSLKSLSYALRKTNELGINNINYIQADILNLEALDKKFDIIESIGVLHHMSDPMVGWQVLTNCLKPGGLMKVGLYSQLGRLNIAKVRKEISKLDIGSSVKAIRSFRDYIIQSEKRHHKKTLMSSDFYSLSTLRDLIFHVQEHRFTIPQIMNLLPELGLEFCGFESNNIVNDFKLKNPKIDAAYDLEKWQVYEESNPDVFAGMYQFWCQKAK